MPCTLDHLVVAAASLEEGVAHVASRLGVAPRPGGVHPGMGTHNALLGLGPGAYLEVIAVDPAAPAPVRTRWFGLDDPAVRAALAVRPRLLHWVARCDDLDAMLTAGGLGVPIPMTRGDYRWRITVPEGGELPMDGVLPTLIAWDGAHPAASLPDSGCRLQRIDATHPDAAELAGRLDALGLGGALHLAAGSRPGLRATLATPSGPVTLD